MNKATNKIITGTLCVLALSISTFPIAHAQGPATGQELVAWQAGQARNVQIKSGNQTAAWTAVNLFSNAVCVAYKTGEWVIAKPLGRKQLKPLVIITSQNIKWNQADHTLWMWGQIDSGLLKGAKVSGTFRELGNGAVIMQMQVVTTGPTQDPKAQSASSNTKTDGDPGGSGGNAETGTPPGTGGTTGTGTATGGSDGVLEVSFDLPMQRFWQAPDQGNSPGTWGSEGAWGP
jgi:hypothetical protein